MEPTVSENETKVSNFDFLETVRSSFQPMKADGKGMGH